MSRRNISKKRFPDSDPKYNSYKPSFEIWHLLESGDKPLFIYVHSSARIQHAFVCVVLLFIVF